ncbi:MAG: hypothetical protein ACYCW6_02855, partial [Candidatus Xenobia bacterium]
MKARSPQARRSPLEQRPEPSAEPHGVPAALPHDRVQLSSAARAAQKGQHPAAPSKGDRASAIKRNVQQVRQDLEEARATSQSVHHPSDAPQHLPDTSSAHASLHPPRPPQHAAIDSHPRATWPAQPADSRAHPTWPVQPADSHAHPTSPVQPADSHPHPTSPDQPADTHPHSAAGASHPSHSPSESPTQAPSDRHPHHAPHPPAASYPKQPSHALLQLPPSLAAAAHPPQPVPHAQPVSHLKPVSHPLPQLPPSLAAAAHAPQPQPATHASQQVLPVAASASQPKALSKSANSLQQARPQTTPASLSGWHASHRPPQPPPLQAAFHPPQAAGGPGQSAAPSQATSGQNGAPKLNIPSTIQGAERQKLQQWFNKLSNADKQFYLNYL